MFEPRSAPLLPSHRFRRRLIAHGLYAAGIVAGSMAVGTIGFWRLGRMAPIDAFLNSAMLLGGMGPVGEIRHTTGKLFAAFFALYAGLVFLVAGALILTPALHRLLHRFHVDEAESRHRNRGE
jgi:hypothetical protein